MHSRRENGFSLIELLVVIAIVALLMSYASVAISSVINGSEMERAGQAVADAVKLARQEAVSKNRETQLAIFELPLDAEGPKGLRGFEIWRVDETPTGLVTNRVTRLQKLPPQIVISEDSSLSPLLSTAAQGTTNAAGQANLKYKTLRFRSNGMLPGASGATNFFTVQSARAKGFPPENYFTILINPLTSKVTTIRP